MSAIMIISRSGSNLFSRSRSLFAGPSGPTYSLRRYASSGKALIKGDTSAPLSQQTLGQLFDSKVEEYEHKDVYRVPFQDIKWTYLELKNHVDAFSNGLWDNKFKRNSILVSSLGQESENFIVHAGSAQVGVNVILTKSGDSLAEIANTIDLAKPHGFIFNPKVYEYTDILKYIPELEQLEPMIPLRSDRFPSLKSVLHTGPFSHFNGTYPFRYVLTYNLKPPVIPKLAKLVRNDDGAIGHTAPNSADASFWSHHSIVNLANFFGKSLHLGYDDRVCVALPASFEAYTLGFWSSISSGSVIVTPSKKAGTIEEILKSLHDQKCTTLLATPQILADLVRNPKFNEYQQKNLLRAVLVGEGSEGLEALSEFGKKTGVSALFSFNPKEGILFDEVKKTGTLLPHLEAKIVDSQGSPVSFHTPGQLKVKGYVVPKGTLSQKAVVDSEGWMNTGTKLQVDEKGNFKRS